MKTHELKTIQPWFGLTWAGKKSFEIRYDDRDYEIGDSILLQEFIPGTSGLPSFFSGRQIKCFITKKFDDFPGIRPGYVVLLIQVEAKFESV